MDELGHDVVLIDASAENIAQLSPDFSGVTAVGFPMDIKSLRAAGIEGCDAVAVATPDDNLNITVGQIAKNFFGIPKVIARISDPYRENIFERFGLQTVCPHQYGGGQAGHSPYQPVAEPAGLVWQHNGLAGSGSSGTALFLATPRPAWSFGQKTACSVSSKDDGAFLLKSQRGRDPAGGRGLPGCQLQD